MTRKLHIPVVEINVTEHCNLQCHCCVHSAPLLPPRFVSPTEVTTDLDALSQAASVVELRIVGGEPLLHPKLLDVMLAARSVHIARWLTLVTNGTLLSSMDIKVWRHIDGMWVSLYPGVTVDMDWNQLRKRALESDTWLWIKQCEYFDDSLLRTRNTNGALVQWIYERCITHPPRFSYCTIRKHRFFMCQRGAYMQDRLHSLGVEYECESADGIALHNDSELAGTIADYLGREQPLRSCAYCLGSAGQPVPCAQELRAKTTDRVPEQPINSKLAHDIVFPGLMSEG